MSFHFILRLFRYDFCVYFQLCVLTDSLSSLVAGGQWLGVDICWYLDDSIL